MKVSLDKKTVANAFHSWRRNRASARKTLTYVSFFMSFLLIALGVVNIVGPIDDRRYVGIALLFIGLCTLPLASVEVCCNALWRRRIRKLFEKTQRVDLAINYSFDSMEITDSAYTTRYRWKDFRAWHESEGIVFLFRRVKVFGTWHGICPIVDLNQVAEEERSSFMTLLRSNVKKVA